MPNIHDFEPLWGEWYTTELLGRGSFGEVYLAEKKELGKTYHSAVKFITIPSDESQTTALFEEGLVKDNTSLKAYYNQLLRALMTEIEVNYSLKGNTNIVSYEAHKIIQRTDAAGYIIIIKMELLSSLNAFIRSRPLTLLDVIKLGEDICTALSVLQRRRVVHRDIKPSNIFINDIGDFKLGDFGVARSMEKAINTMSIKGTFTFMPPEVARGDDGDYRVDIYSLGLVLYRLLNGNRSPFLPPPPARISYDENLQAQKKRLQGKDMPAPAFADARLAQIILKACAYNPEDRWESAYDMKQQLMDYRYALSGTDTAQQVLLDYSGMELEPTASCPSYSLEEDYWGDAEQTMLLAVDEDATMVLLTEESTGRQFLKLRKDYQNKPVYMGGSPAQQAADEQPQQSKRFWKRWRKKHTIPDETVPVPVPEEPTMPQDEHPWAEWMKKRSKSAEVVIPASEDAVKPAKKYPWASRKDQQPNLPVEDTAVSEASTQPVRQPWKALEKGRFVRGIAIATVIVLLINLLTLFFSDTQMADEPPVHDNNTVGDALPPEDTNNQPEEEPPQQSLVWQDEKVAELACQVLQKDLAEITAADLLQVEKLDFTGLTIQSLADLAHFPALKILNLEGQRMIDLEQLLQLPNLEELSLRDTELTDASALAQIKSLKRLDLSNNQLTSLDFAAELTELIYLDITQNNISSLQPLADLENLRVIVADNNPINDWETVTHVAYVSGRPPQIENETPEQTGQAAEDPSLGQAEPDDTVPSGGASTGAAHNTTTVPPPTADPIPEPNEPTPPPQTNQNRPEPSTIAVTGVTISRASAIMDTGTSLRLTAQVLPENATNQAVNWSSSNTAVATVYNGTVTAKSPGTVVITVTCSGFSASCTINVN